MRDLTAGKASVGTSILRRLMFSAISKSAFFRQSGWMLFAATLSGVFFYAVHFFAGRKMDPDEYGAFNALLQVLTQMAIPSVGLLTIFVQQAALAESEAHRRELAGAVRSVLKATFFFWLATATLVFLFQSRLLADYKIQNPVALWATVALGLVSLWTPVMQGILQGRQNFLWLGMIPIVSAFTRLVLVAVIVTMLASALFSTGQVKDPSRLAEKLCAAADPVSRCLWDRFSAEAQRTLKSPESAPGWLEPVLNEGLNRILRGPSLFEPERFAGVRLSKESRLRLTQSLEGEELVRLNRRLMEDAYPHEIGVNPLRARQAAGAMLGVLFSMMAALGLGVWQTLPLWRGAAAGFCWTPWLKRVLPLALGMGSTTFMFTIDMLAVQRFLPESGIYG